jgi:photosystem II stability/assembly factor-like uncharacterized protein
LPVDAGPRYDAPDAAEEFARAKRLSGASVADPRAAYDRAIERRAAMPSIALAAEGREASKAGLPSRWEALGPGNIGGRTRVLLIDPRDPAVLYAAGVSGGVFKSIDEGGRWFPVGDELANIAVNALVMDPKDSAVLFAGTGEGYFREEVRGTRLPLRGGGIFVTTDGGASWSRLESTAGEDFHWVNDLAISAHDASRLYAATRTGVWRSEDRGATWTRVLATDVKGGCLDLALRPGADRDVLFASCGTFEPATIYRNTAADGNGAWESVLTRPEMGRTTLAIAPSDPDVVYALSASNVPIAGSPPQGLLAVFRSTEGGSPGSWEERVRGDDPAILHRLLLTNSVAMLPKCEDGSASSKQFVTMGWYCNVIAVDPGDANTVWVGGVDLFRSGDGGRTWAAASSWFAEEAIPFYVHADQHGITFRPGYGESNRTMYVANDGGVFRTLDARAPLATGIASVCDPQKGTMAWESLNRGLGVTQFYHGAVFPGGAAWVGGTQDNGTILGREDLGPDGWSRILGGDGGYVAIDPANPSKIWAEYQNGVIHISQDGGANFEAAPPGDDPSDRFLFVTPFAADARVPQRLWTGGSRIWRTDDEGTTWERASAVLAANELVSAIAVSPHDSQVVFAGTTGGRILTTFAGASANGFTAWVGGQPRVGFVSSLAFDPYDARVVYATYAGFGGAHAWRTSDRGETWEAIDGSGEGALPDIPVHSLAIDPRDTRRLYAGSDLGVFVSLDGGATWMAEREGIPAAVTETVVLARAGGRLYLYAFTHGRGVFRTELGPVPRRRAVIR